MRLNQLTGKTHTHTHRATAPPFPPSMFLSPVFLLSLESWKFAALSSPLSSRPNKNREIAHLYSLLLKFFSAPSSQFGTLKMSNGEHRKISRSDIQVVQNLIERCLQLYMTEEDVVTTLKEQAKIEPAFTELVWQKLEMENQEFFKSYKLRLMLKDQIISFNKLLEKQVEMMSQKGPTSTYVPNGSHIPPSAAAVQCTSLPQDAALYASEYPGPKFGPDSMHHLTNYSNPNSFAKAGPPLHPGVNPDMLPCIYPGMNPGMHPGMNPGMHPGMNPGVHPGMHPGMNPGMHPGMNPGMHPAVGISTHSRRLEVPPDMLLSNSLNMGLGQGMNGIMFKRESGSASNPAFMLSPDGNFFNPYQTNGHVSAPPFGGISNGQPLNEALINSISPMYDFLPQVPRNFSLSDPSAGYCQSSGNNRKMDTISDMGHHEGFRSSSEILSRSGSTSKSNESHT